MEIAKHRITIGVRILNYMTRAQGFFPGPGQVIAGGSPIGSSGKAIDFRVLTRSEGKNRKHRIFHFEACKFPQ